MLHITDISYSQIVNHEILFNRVHVIKFIKLWMVNLCLNT